MVNPFVDTVGIQAKKTLYLTTKICGEINNPQMHIADTKHRDAR